MPDKKAILALETKFWDTMKSQDADTASSLVANESLVTGPSGVSKIDKTSFKKMMEDGKWTLEDYKFSDMQIFFPNDDTAIVGYKVHQKGTMGGKPYDMNCADASTWMRTNGDWQCVLHTETQMGKPG